MSSHREAPEIARDPVADNTDVYAFVSPDDPEDVTLIANFLPLQGAAGGPNFFAFGDDVLYSINISNHGDARPDISYRFRFTERTRNPNTFLYNTGPIESVDSPNWNRPQTYSVTRVTRDGRRAVLAEALSCPPCNIGPLSTPNYAALARGAVHRVGRMRVFAGQRADGFFVDLGAVFDLLDLRPFQNLHLEPRPAANGVNGLRSLNVHTIAIKVPKRDLTRGGAPGTNPAAPSSVIGVWATASRRKGRVLDPDSGRYVESGPFVQVSRLGNPLFNEVLVPISKKDYWNAQPPADDIEFARYVEHPEVARLLPALYPGVFPHLAALRAARADLVAILLTGLPPGIVPGFQNFTGPTKADLLRLNVAIPPTPHPSPLGILGGDLAGFPNGRRPADDVTTIELRAIAGATYPLVQPAFVPDAAASAVTDGTRNDNQPFLGLFPYLGTPNGGFQVRPGRPGG